MPEIIAVTVVFVVVLACRIFYRLGYIKAQLDQARQEAECLAKRKRDHE